MTHPFAPEPATKSAPQNASGWFARLRSDRCDEADRRAFSAWLEADPRHGEEYRRLESLWRVMGSVDVSDFFTWAGVAASSTQRLSRPSLRRRMLAAAAGLCLAVGSAWWLQIQWTAGHYLTGLGERRTVSLEDGTKLELNTDTELRVSYSETQRSVDLQRGEVYLEVARNHQRPLVVKAGAGEVKVLGTRFSVYRDSRSVRVGVTEGWVQVDAAGPGTARREAKLGPGQFLSYTDQGKLSAPSSTDIDSLQAWRRGELVFRNQALAEVIEELRRYDATPVDIKQASLAQTRISGIFKIGDLRTTLAAIAVTLNAKVEWEGGRASLSSESGQSQRP